MPSPILIYGAYGYTGRLVVREAVRRGVEVVLAGRNRDRLCEVAATYGLPSRVFGLDDAARLRTELAGVAVVLHCAGPFVDTSAPMRRACLATGTGYVDITGEVDVFEAVMAEDREAARAGVVLLPGAGFDVVPSDCLAAMVASRLRDPVALEIAFAGGAGISRGTLRTMLRAVGGGVVVRRGGKLVRVPWGRISRTVTLFGRPRRVTAIPWGDVSTAYSSTKVPDITVYTDPGGPWMGRLLPVLSKAVEFPAVPRILDRVARASSGPPADRRARARVALWARCIDGGGRSVCGRLEVPDGYDLTARTALECALRVARGEVRPGAHTPVTAFGPDFVAGFPDVAVQVPAPC